MHRAGEDREFLREELLSEEEVSCSRFESTSQNLHCQKDEGGTLSFLLSNWQSGKPVN